MTAGGEDDAGTGVGLAGHPGAVEGVGEQEEGHHQDEEPGDALLLGVLRHVRLVPALLAPCAQLPVADVLRGLARCIFSDDLAECLVEGVKDIIQWKKDQFIIWTLSCFLDEFAGGFSGRVILLNGCLEFTFCVDSFNLVFSMILSNSSPPSASSLMVPYCLLSMIFIANLLKSGILKPDIVLLYRI